ncbi:MAG: polyribonucleotide nucleotidyltransferase [Spirochaetes bacterium]|nr:polyribonucleotide nucleotidyltransferase [Spirochaetota bacterium]MBP8991839.1 polyribonucleotide nucleotidyltransferase [Spirochaetota bacterium]HOV46569.1 polyribonucleotide nucleotidyltransferase [Exilispira sp.]HQM89354.1 polyribonucleotide nucleotidyltransferase [Exilispira sp.]
MKTKFDVDFGSGVLTFEINKVARQANGSTLARFGDTAVLSAAVMGPNLKQDFFPLTVHYFEKAYAAGKIPGGFIKREGKPSDREILVSRLIDRPIRPLFPKEFTREVQVVSYTIATDQVHTPDVLAINASSVALAVSDIPFIKPIGAVRVGYIDGKFVINPDLNLMTKSELDIVVAGTYDAITMVEGSGREVSESLLLEACKLAHQHIQKIVTGIEEIAKEAGKAKIVVEPRKEDTRLNEAIKNLVEKELEEALFIHDKLERQDAIEAVKQKYLPEIKKIYAKSYLEEKKSEINRAEHSDKLDMIDKEGLLDEEEEALLEDFEADYYDYFDAITRNLMRESILGKGIRPDGRKTNEIRPISIELNLFNYTHGSALFTRGETQALAITTLGSISDAQILDNIEGELSKRFMLHYNFPPFSVGETGKYGPPGRREIGHGHLAERSIEVMLPDYDTFPYVIRTVSEILESNGSSSMATVCGTSLSLYSAGVPMQRLVAGIAMGLVKEDDRYAILSDIMGMEDHLGDMDFKVAGTSNGITGFQMDVKIEGINFDIFSKALEQAKEGRMHILSLMNEATANIPCAVSEKAPKIFIMQIDEEKVGALIGPGGKVIKSIISETGSDISVEPDAKVVISNRDKQMLEQTIQIIQNTIDPNPKVDEVYTGVVKKIFPYGVLVEFMPKIVGMLHISEVSNTRINSIEEKYRVGDRIKVRLIRIDDQGKYSLSAKEFN